MVAAASHGAGISFRISFIPAIQKLMTPLGVGPAHSIVVVDSYEVRVRMGWAFTMTIPRDQIASVTRAAKPFGTGMGVHSWRGRWVVNGSNDGIVRLVFKTSLSARVMRFPIKPRELFVSLEDPVGFIAALGIV